MTTMAFKIFCVKFQRQLHWICEHDDRKVKVSAARIRGSNGVPETRARVHRQVPVQRQAGVASPVENQAAWKTVSFYFKYCSFRLVVYSAAVCDWWVALQKFEKVSNFSQAHCIFATDCRSSLNEPLFRLATFSGVECCSPLHFNKDGHLNNNFLSITPERNPQLNEPHLKSLKY